MFRSKHVCLLFALLSLLPLARATSAAEEWKPLWPDGTPQATGQEAHDIPALLAYPADEQHRNGCAVVVCPGGGYGGLAMDHEGHQIARYLNDLGISAFILRYRLGSKGYHHPVQKGDVLRAIRTVRHAADDYHIDPQRIGVMGFSAGGHLASTAGTHYDLGLEDAADPIDRVSSRPDFMILCYPVITMDKEFTHFGSRRNLLGPDNVDNPELVELLSNERRVNDKTPPTFLFHTTEDQAVPVENAIRFYLALRANGVRCELHVYQKGRHGVGLAADDPVLKTWPGHLSDWLKTNQFIK